MSIKDFSKDTQFQSGAKAVENGKKGGIASGKARREKADLRKAVQEALLTSYTDKKGNTVTGKEAFIQSLIANVSNPNSRNWAKAASIFIELTGANIAPEELQKTKAETKVLEQKAKLLSGVDDTGLKKLDEILEGLEVNARKSKPDAAAK